MKGTIGHSVLILTALLVSAAWVFFPMIDAGFVAFDDSYYVTDNPVVTRGLTATGVRWAFSAPRLANYHPLALLSHMLDVELFGLWAGGHHLTSVLLHLVNTLLLFGALRALTGAVYRSALVAALFAVHPMHVESVAWVSERKDVLCGVFWLLTMLAYTRFARRGGSVNYALVLLAFAAGLIAKPMIVTLPFVLLLLDFWPLSRVTLANGSMTIAAAVREKLPLFGLAVLLGAVTFAAQAGGGAVVSLEHYNLLIRAEKVIWAYGEYLTRIVWPQQLSVFYPQPLVRPPTWQIGAWGVLLAGATAGAFRLRVRAPWFLVGWLWFLGTLLPVSGILQVGLQFIADRYTYLPSIGLFVAVVWGAAAVARRIGRDQPAAIGAVLLIVPLAVAARTQVGYWRDSASLFGHALAVNRDNWMALVGLGVDRSGHGDLASARSYFEQALRINPDSALARFNYGTVLAAGGKAAEAAEQFRQALRSDPSYVAAYSALADQALREGHPETAIGHLGSALAIDPNYAAARNRLGLILAAEGRMDEAIEHFSAAVRIVPTDPAVHFNLGSALDAVDRLEQAIGHYRASLSFRPGDAATHNNLGIALARSGRMEEARRQFQEALRADPGFEAARKNLERF